MTKHLKATGATLVTGLLMISILVSLAPTTSAGLLFNLQSVLNVTWNDGNNTNEPVVPRGELRQLPIVIQHTVTRGALGRGMLQVYTGSPITISVEIVESSPWCTANLGTGTLTVTVQPDKMQEVETQLSMQVEEDAPAFGLGYVKIRATAAKAGLIAAFSNEFTLNFIPDYKPLIKPTLPDTNAKEIGPMDTAVFPIQIENLGNARTIVYLDVVDVPENWNAVITSQVTLEEGAGSTATAYLVIKPPKGAGYHFDERTIKISMQPVKADDQTKRGIMTYESFLVQSRGFSTPGFEALYFVGALALALLAVYGRKRLKK